MKKKIIIAEVIIGMFLVIMAANVMLVQANEDDFPCTPGYWKNHSASWPAGYNTQTALGTVFVLMPPELSEISFIDALNFGGRKGVQGAQQILARAAVAALLNAATSDSGVGGYPFTAELVISMTNGALNPGNRDKMISLAEEFDIYNNS